ncbi:MAG: preprotein translocase subunit SecG [Patescibacteria group bacterium]
MNLSSLVQPIQLFCIIAIICLILIQNRGASLSQSFGGNNEVYLTRRGVEKFVVYLTVFFAFLYTAVTIAAMY